MVRKSESAESLVEEKIKLATKIGIWHSFNPIEGYAGTAEYARIQEINKLLDKNEPIQESAKEE